jgi:hypothetical protein
MAETMRVVVNQSALGALFEGLGTGVHRMAEQVVLEAEAGKPKGAKSWAVTMYRGKKIGGSGEVPKGVPQSINAVEAFAVFGFPSAFKELGTPAHTIGVNTTKHSAKYWASHKPKATALHLKDGAFRASVHHPGSRPQPFINPAAAAVAGRSDSIIAAGVPSAFKQ